LTSFASCLDKIDIHQKISTLDFYLAPSATIPR